MRSGNLNYTMGLLKAQSRHGLGMGFALSYNSQTWRNADGMTWNMGRDVGYGYGFKLLAGSIYPVYNNGSVALYILTDSSGAEYRLDVGSSGHWWSREGVYLHFDPAGKLWFSDVADGGGVLGAGAGCGDDVSDDGAGYERELLIVSSR
jgi:hypothetical protein